MVNVCKECYIYNFKVGHGNTEQQLLPKEISFTNQPKLKYIAAGSAHSAAITLSGTIFMWGYNVYGQCMCASYVLITTTIVGNNSKENCLVPTLVTAFLKSDPCQQIALGANHSIALMKNGKVYAWGAGSMLAILLFTFCSIWTFGFEIRSRSSLATANQIL